VVAETAAALLKGCTLQPELLCAHFDSCAWFVFASSFPFCCSMSTAVLLIVLALQYQSLWGFFAFLVVLDIVSHWFQMVSEHCDAQTCNRAASFIGAVFELPPVALLA
jgi:hypothetical protein